jgi:hypothetical protein
MSQLNTWERISQEGSDHDWMTWMADPRDFRDCRFDPLAGWTGPAATVRSITNGGTSREQ